MLELSDPVDTGETDDYIDNLLNDILAGGVSDITGEEAAFDALLGNDVEVEEVGEIGELIGAEVGELAEATAVEDALGILFDQGAEQGHNSPFGGLLGGLTNDDSV
ncbi:hypothetical protein ACFQFQ_04085 [Sulfitobacter porphyrae]|uniref:Uncharacterized protein n=1 Tax=Sulfitobacter porphyrae TaxID=1246864 RepID=A0ABW2B1V7_9RHOB|nr:hypothetical protein GCM10007928_14190 [Sulfitobacter porphyrae]